MIVYEIRFREGIPLPLPDGRSPELQVADQWFASEGVSASVSDGMLEFELPKRWIRGKVLVASAKVSVPLSNVAYLVTGPPLPPPREEAEEEAPPLPKPKGPFQGKRGKKPRT